MEPEAEEPEAAEPAAVILMQAPVARLRDAERVLLEAGIESRIVCPPGGGGGG